MALSKRLQQLDRMITRHYAHIWDGCCDHGQLGMALVARAAATHVHFVDIVPELIHHLTQQLTAQFSDPAPTDIQPTTSQWHTYCMDVALLPLNRHAGSQLVILAGVGGDLMADLVEAIVLANPQCGIEFLLCPVHHTYTLRQRLQAMRSHCLDECLIEENQRYYEILHVASGNIRPTDWRPVSSVGQQLWQSRNDEEKKRAQRYLKTLLAHYQRVHLRYPEKAAPILAAYQALITENYLINCKIGLNSSLRQSSTSS